MSYTTAQVAAVRQKAYEIAVRGVTYVMVDDRQHRFTDPEKLEAFALTMEAQILDEEFGGMIDIKFGSAT